MNTINQVIETLVEFKILSKTYIEQFDIFELNMNSSPFIFKAYDSEYGDWIDIVSIDLENDGTYIANTVLTDDSTVELTLENFLILETVNFDALYGRLKVKELSSKFQESFKESNVTGNTIMKTVETYCGENGIKFDVEFICDANDKLMDYCNDNDIDYLGDVLNDHWEFDEALIVKCLNNQL